MKISISIPAKWFVIAVISTVLCMLGLIVLSTRDTACGDPTLDAAIWQVKHSTLPSRIIWQKTEQRARDSGIGHIEPNLGLVASHQQVLFWRVPADTVCDANYGLRTFDSNTGKSRWGFAPNTSLLRQVASVQDGYIVLSDGVVTKLDTNGREIWINSSIPSRGAKTLYEAGDSIYIPSYAQVYQLAARTGLITRVIPTPNIVTYWGDFAVVALNNNQLGVIDLNTNAQLYTIALSDPTPLTLALRNLWPFISRSDNVLMLYNEYNAPYIQVYQLDTGTLLWQSKKAFYGSPLIVGDLVFVYSADGLEIYNAKDGKKEGTIELVRVINGTEDQNPQNDVWLAYDDNTLFIAYRNTWELIALRIDSRAYLDSPSKQT